MSSCPSFFCIALCLRLFLSLFCLSVSLSVFIYLSLSLCVSLHLATALATAWSFRHPAPSTGMTSAAKHTTDISASMVRLWWGKRSGREGKNVTNMCVIVCMSLQLQSKLPCGRLVGKEASAERVHMGVTGRSKAEGRSILNSTLTWSWAYWTACTCGGCNKANPPLVGVSTQTQSQSETGHLWT